MLIILGLIRVYKGTADLVIKVAEKSTDSTKGESTDRPSQGCDGCCIRA